MATLTQVSVSKCHGGLQKIFSHTSKVLKCEMKFSAYLPPQTDSQKLPVLYWLSGLTCTEKNFIEKSGFQQHAAKHGIIVIGPDTSPRGCNIPGEDDSYDFGSGAGFSVDATEKKWAEHYKMYSYVTQELPELIQKHFDTNGIMSIFGHSMGGHGAIISTLKNPGKYRSVSAFAPICNPIECPWGKKCLSGYIGEDKETWKAYDSTCLTQGYSGPPIEIFIDQGADDQFLHDGQLLPDNLVAASNENKNISVKLRKHEGYDHSYYFISTFIGDHFDYHAQCLARTD